MPLPNKKLRDITPESFMADISLQSKMYGVKPPPGFGNGTDQKFSVESLFKKFLLQVFQFDGVSGLANIVNLGNQDGNNPLYFDFSDTSKIVVSWGVSSGIIPIFQVTSSGLEFLAPVTGDGSDLTNLNADNLSSGTVPDARMADTAVTPGSYSSANITVDAKGRVIAAVAGTVAIQLAASDVSTAITAGTNKVTFRMPYAATLIGVRASVSTAPTGSTFVIDINQNGTTVLSTKLSIDASEKTSTTAAVPAVISVPTLTDDAEITIDFDQVGSSVAGAGVIVTLLVTQT